MTPVLVLHTTESDDLAATAAFMLRNRVASHRIFDPLTGQRQQLVPWTSSARSLRNLTGGVETNNRGGVFQLEIIGRATLVPTYGDVWYQNLASEVIAICDQLGVPRHFPCQFVPYPQSYGTGSGVRLSNAEWLVVGGIVGHMHVPENLHGDPGDISKLVPLVERPPASTKPNERLEAMPATVSLTDCQNYVDRSYDLANVPDPRGRRYWTRVAAEAGEPVKVLGEMDRQLGLA